MRGKLKINSSAAILNMFVLIERLWIGWSNGNPLEAVGRHKLWPVQTWALLVSGLYVPASCMVESLRASVQMWKLSGGKRKLPKRFASLHCPTTTNTFVYNCHKKNSWLKYWNTGIDWGVLFPHSYAVLLANFFSPLSTSQNFYHQEKESSCTLKMIYNTPKI